jgi:hypothetical protein
MNALLVIVLPAVALAIVWILIARRPRPEEPARPPRAPDPGGSVPPPEPDFAEPAVARIFASTTGDDAAKRDPVRLLEDAVLIAAEVGVPSKLVLQRRLGLSFDQAGDLVHRMEELGLVSRVGHQHQVKLLPVAYDFAREISERRAKSGEPDRGEER